MRRRQLFRRMLPVLVTADGKCFWRHGAVEKIGREQVTAFETVRYGRLTSPLYRYMGDAAELLQCDRAVLEAGSERFTVLHAEAIMGPSGAVYTEAILERQEMPDDRT